MENAAAAAADTHFEGDNAAPGVVVRYDHHLPGYERCAVLLATIARPPANPADRGWADLVRAFCRLHFHEGEQSSPAEFEEPQPGPVTWGHLTFPLERAKTLVDEARATLNARLVASHALLPFLWEGLGRAGKTEFLGYTARGTLANRIHDIVQREADRLDVLAARHGETPRARFQMGRNEIQDKNFLTKVLLPARPVLHIAAALDHVMELTSAELRKAGNAPVADMLEIDVRGPQIHGWFLERMPELADAVVAVSRLYEQALPYLRVQKPEPTSVVRFRPCAAAAEVSA